MTGLALAACTGGSSDGSSDDNATEPSTAGTSSAPSSPTVAGATEEAARPAPPEVGACYDLGFEAATAPTSDAEPVSCREPHTAQTYYVGRLDLDVDGHLLAVDSERAQRQVARACPRRLDRHLGGDAEEHALSRLRAVWFSPTLQESDAGASWFRCDVVAIARAQTLAPLPRPKRLRGILDRENALTQVGLCGTAAPGANGFERVICSRRHAWRAVSTIDIAGGRAYPGAARVRRAGAETCRSLVREASGSPERFRYGWEWPTREQWRTGQRFGFCWAPD